MVDAEDALIFSISLARSLWTRGQNKLRSRRRRRTKPKRARAKSLLAHITRFARNTCLPGVLLLLTRTAGSSSCRICKYRASVWSLSAVQGFRRILVFSSISAPRGSLRPGSSLPHEFTRKAEKFKPCWHDAPLAFNEAEVCARRRKREIEQKYFLNAVRGVARMFYDWMARSILRLLHWRIRLSKLWKMCLLRKPVFIFTSVCYLDSYIAMM